eukprot:954022-Amorphochlora_amoeboformis.AAC.1
MSCVETGDWIVGADGQNFSSSEIPPTDQFQMALEKAKNSNSKGVTLKVLKHGKKDKTPVDIHHKLNFHIIPAYVDAKNNPDNSLKVKSVVDMKKLQRGDIIMKINGNSIDNMTFNDSLDALTRTVAEGRTRGKSSMKLEVKKGYKYIVIDHPFIFKIDPAGPQDNGILVGDVVLSKVQRGPRLEPNDVVMAVEGELMRNMDEPQMRSMLNRAYTDAKLKGKTSIKISVKKGPNSQAVRVKQLPDQVIIPDYSSDAATPGMRVGQILDVKNLELGDVVLSINGKPTKGLKPVKIQKELDRAVMRAFSRGDANLKLKVLKGGSGQPVKILHPVDIAIKPSVAFERSHLGGGVGIGLRVARLIDTTKIEPGDIVKSNDGRDLKDKSQDEIDREMKRAIDIAHEQSRLMLNLKVLKQGYSSDGKVMTIQHPVDVRIQGAPALEGMRVRYTIKSKNAPVLDVNDKILSINGKNVANMDRKEFQVELATAQKISKATGEHMDLEVLKGLPGTPSHIEVPIEMAFATQLSSQGLEICGVQDLSRLEPGDIIKE